MKTLNALVISGLVVFSANTLAATDNLDSFTAQMNQDLQNRIETQLEQLLQVENRERKQAVVKAEDSNEESTRS